MTANEKRIEVVKSYETRIGKNSYTQDAKRDYFYGYPKDGNAGYSDCSSSWRAAYKRIAAIDIGGNTVAQVNNAGGRWVDWANGNYKPNIELLPGDLLYFKGTDTSRPYMVGHVEGMSRTNGKLIGHGSGTGPSYHDLDSYCKNRYNQGKGYIGTKRFILEDAISVAQARITGGTVNIRRGPGTGYAVAGIGKKGEMYKVLETNDWIPVVFNGEICWVSPNMCERV